MFHSSICVSVNPLPSSPPLPTPQKETYSRNLHNSFNDKKQRMAALPSAAKIIALFEELDDGKTGSLPTGVVKAMLMECGEKFKEPEMKTLLDDMDKDGMCNYRFYVESILCNSEGIGHYKNWLKQ